MDEDFEVRIPREIKNFKEKFFMDMTLRQLVCGVIGIVIGFLTYFGFKNKINTELLEWIVVLLVSPIFAIGFLRFQDLPFEKFVPLIFVQKFIYDKPLLYKQSSQLFSYTNGFRREEFYENKKAKGTKKQPRVYKKSVKE